MTSLILSPCESCLTLAESPQQYNAQYVSSYLASRPINNSTDTMDQNHDAEFTIAYNYTNINVKLSSILCLVNIHSSKKITINEVTVNHLFLYLHYHQCTLFQKSDIHICQLTLAHLGKRYLFSNLYSLPSPTLINDLKIDTYPNMLLTIRDGDFVAYRFDIGTFLSTQLTFVDKSTGDLTYMDTWARKLKDLQKHKRNNTTGIRKRSGFRVFFKKIAV